MNRQDSAANTEVGEELEFVDSQETRGYLEKEKEATNISGFGDVGAYLFGTNADRTFNELKDHVEVSPLSPTLSSQTSFPPVPKRESSMKERILHHISPPLEVVEQRINEKLLRVAESDEIDDLLLNQLCSHENGFEILSQRVKETINSAKDASTFLKKRAQLEENYANEMLKLGTQASREKGKGESYGDVWSEFIEMHRNIGLIRLKFAASIAEMAENIDVLYRNTVRGRKQLKDAANKQQKELNNATSQLELARSKFELSSEDWERAQGIEVKKSKPVKSFINFKAKLQHDLKLTPKTEEDARYKAAQANENYKQALQRANGLKSEYYSRNLPRLVRGLMDTNVDCDEGLQKYLQKYANSVESLLMDEATTINPLEPSQKLGLLRLIQKIDISNDITMFVGKHQLGSRKESIESFKYVPYVDEDALRNGAIKKPFSNHSQQSVTPITSPVAIASNSVSFRYFGNNLQSIMENDPNNELVPLLVTNCIEYVEISGINQEGIYRVSGFSNETQNLRSILESDPQFPLENVVDDVNNVTGVLKLFFRELTDPLFPRTTYSQFIAAARIGDPRERLLAVHTLINALPDPNYATLKDLVCHLAKVAAKQDENKMSETNLGIVWGPTLLDSGTTPDPSEFKYQSELVEFVIQKFDQIFEVE